MRKKWLTAQDINRAFKIAWDADAWDAVTQEQFLYLYEEYKSLKLDLLEQECRARARALRNTARYFSRPAMRRHGNQQVLPRKPSLRRTVKSASRTCNRHHRGIAQW